jgi:hypothetical protein
MRNNQYAPSLKFILNIYTWLHNLKKKTKSRVFLRREGVGRPLLFFQTVQPTKIIMDTVYRLLTKSNSYTVLKKIGLNFFTTGGGEQTITFL